jgi:hypothetical protein
VVFAERHGWAATMAKFQGLLLGLEKGEASADLEAIRQDSQRQDRENGVYYQKQLRWAKKHDPDIIFVSAWNDWQYGNHIEPAVEYQFQYLDLTAKVLGRWKETEAYRKDSGPTA